MHYRKSVEGRRSPVVKLLNLKLFDNDLAICLKLSFFLFCSPSSLTQIQRRQRFSSKQLFLFKASDEDSGFNGAVIYSPANVSNSLNIRVNRTSGVISIHKVPKIDTDCRNATVQFDVIAKDGGQSPKSAIQHITINIMVSCNALLLLSLTLKLSIIFETECFKTFIK